MNPSKAGRSLRRRRFLLFLLLTLGAAFWIFRPVPTLSDRATRLLSGVNRYFWRAPSDIYIGERQGDGKLRRFQIAGSRLSEKEILPEPGEKYASEYQVSPNGHWLLYSYGSPRPNLDVYGQHVGVVSLTEPHRIDVNDDSSWSSEGHVQQSAVWMPDNSRWISLDSGTNLSSTAWLRSIDTTIHAARPVSLRASGLLLGVTKTNRILSTDFHPGIGPPATNVSIYESGLFPDPSSSREWTLKAPPGTDVRELVLSPQQDRLAWLVYSARVPVITRLLGRVLPSFRKYGRPVLRLSIFVSKIDGTGLHEVGYQPVGNLGGPHHLRWAPDGRNLSFLLNNGLYLIPVD
jgi:hypothetical protein